MPKCLTLRGPDIALIIHREAIKQDRIVYVGTANRLQQYSRGKSKIVYIGTTRSGADRVASSAAKQAKKLLWDWGLHELTFHRIYCPRRQNLSTWKLLEAGLIDQFDVRYGNIPRGNKNRPSHDRVAMAKKYFTTQRLATMIEILSG